MQQQNLISPRHSRNKTEIVYSTNAGFVDLSSFFAQTDMTLTMLLRISSMGKLVKVGHPQVIELYVSFLTPVFCTTDKN